MRGGFVACFGERSSTDDLAHAAAAMRWHHGRPVEHGVRGFRAVTLVDPADGPVFTPRGEGAEIVHGDMADSRQELERRGRRFAVIEYDGSRLTASRDPLGLCPLFYRTLADSIWLSSEIAPLVSLAPVRADLRALAAQAAIVPDPVATGFEGIFRVAPGHRLEVDPGLSVRQIAYWRPAELLGSYRGTRAAAETELRERFSAAVERAVSSTAGILLSGGIDSTSVAGVATRFSQDVRLVHVHFAGFADAEEEMHARRLADAIGLPLEVVRGELQAWRPEADLELTVVPYLSQPFYTGEAALARLAEQGVSTALDGNDGDGVLGYTGREWGELLRTRSFRRLRELAEIHGRRTVVHEILEDTIPPALRLRKLRRRPALPVTYLQLVERYFEPRLASQMQRIDHERWQSPLREWRARQLRQVRPVTTTRNEEHELRAARFGIDLRHPFGDRELVEFLISLPASVKSDPFRAKALLRDALRPVLPQGVLDRLDKPEYNTVFGSVIDSARCLEWIRDSAVELPGVNYDQLYRDGDRGAVPRLLLMTLARSHVFAAAYA